MPFCTLQHPPCWALVRAMPPPPVTLLYKARTRTRYSPHFDKLHQRSSPTILSVFFDRLFCATDGIFSFATKGHLLKYSRAAEDS